MRSTGSCWRGVRARTGSISRGDRARRFNLPQWSAQPHRLCIPSDDILDAQCPCQRDCRIPGWIYLLFGSWFARDAQPYQDMSILIKARNDLVHYKMASNPPRYLKHLIERNIALSPQPTLPGEMARIHQLCSSEVVRWANSTATKLVQFMPNNARDYMFGQLAANYFEISEDVPKEHLLKAGIDPQSTNP